MESRPAYHVSVYNAFIVTKLNDGTFIRSYLPFNTTWHICECICIFIYVYVCVVYVYMYFYGYVCYMCIVYMSVYCIYIYMCIYVCVFVYMYIYKQRERGGRSLFMLANYFWEWDLHWDVVDISVTDTHLHSIRGNCSVFPVSMNHRQLLG